MRRTAFVTLLLLTGACGEAKNDAAAPAGQAPEKAKQGERPAEEGPTTIAAPPAATGEPERSAEDKTRKGTSRAPGDPGRLQDARDGDLGATALAAVAEGDDAGRSKEEITTTISTQASSFQPCLKVDMRVRIEAQVDASGSLSDVKATRAEPNDPAVNDCLVAAFGKLVFPKTSSGKSSKLALDLALKKAVNY